MNNKRFSQLRNLSYYEEDLRSNIKSANKDLLEKIWDETLREYIIYYLEKNQVSSIELENIFIKAYFANKSIINKDVSLFKELQKILIENIILPDYTENKQDFFEEVDEILKRADKKITREIQKRQDWWFFSIVCLDFSNIYSEFTFAWFVWKRFFDVWWVFWKCSIEDNWSLTAEIPIRLSEKVRDWEQNDNFLKTIREEELNKILNNILIWKWNKRYFKDEYKNERSVINSNKEKIKGDSLKFYKKLKNKILEILKIRTNENYLEKDFWEERISVEISKELDKSFNYWNDNKASYKVLKISLEDSYFDDDMSKEEMSAIFNKIFDSVSFLINTIAKESGIEHKNRFINYANGSIIIEVWNTNEDEINNISRSDYEKFESLRVKLSEKITLEDIWWQEKAKIELDKIIKSIKFEEIMKSWWAKSTSWIVFEWPAWTWKTLLAKAIASEIDADVYNIKLTDIASSAYINEGSKNVKNLFSFIRYKSKQSNKKIIIILDELDALFTKRWNDRASQEDTKIVNTFLTEMSWLEDLWNVIFIWTTNLLENIDPAVIRSWRLTTKVKVNLPDEEWIKQIYQIHIDKIKKKSSKFANNINWISLNSIVQKSKWLSWADIEEVVRIIAEQKAMQEISWEEITQISENDFFEAIEKLKIRWKKSSIGFMNN